MTDREIAIEVAKAEQEYWRKAREEDGPAAGACACIGPVNGEPLCNCDMNRLERAIGVARAALANEQD